GGGVGARAASVGSACDKVLATGVVLPAGVAPRGPSRMTLQLGPNVFPVRRTAESRRPSDANIVWASSVSVMAVSRVRPLPSRRIDHILCGTEDNRPDVGPRSARNHPGGLADEQSDHDRSDPARARPLVGGL